MKKKHILKPKFLKRYAEGSLSEEDVRQMPSKKQTEYLTRELKKKYKSEIKYSCEECAITALYRDNGYITDEELIECTGLRHK